MSSPPPSPASKPLEILILGGGISGLTTALALTHFSPPSHPPPKITILEIRPEPATIGGAVNLTPNALRLLHHLGALQEIQKRGSGAPCEAVEVFDSYTGAKIAESSFRGPTGKGIGDPPFMALRIGRGEALRGVLDVIVKRENIELLCGKKTVKIGEGESRVNLTFEDGEQKEGDILIGCDGIHSAARLLHVEPERKATYSGICNAFGFAKRIYPREAAATGTSSNGSADETEKSNEPHNSSAEPLSEDSPNYYDTPHFTTSGMNFSRHGILLTSFHSPCKSSIYIGALMQLPSIRTREGWKALGADATHIRSLMMQRFGSSAALPIIRRLIRDAQDLYLWPVYSLPPGGQWFTQRVILIGDAAHAMPPQGESTALSLENTVLFSRILARWGERGGDAYQPIEHAFRAYDKLRRPRIDVAWRESQSVVRTVKDAGSWGHWVKMMIVPWYLWWTGRGREQVFEDDVCTMRIEY